MQHLIFAVDSLEAAMELKDMLWEQLEVRGEVELIPQEHSKYRLNVISEKTLSTQQLEKLPGKLI
ncbi:hypothetical protein [Sulfobacillus thermosulfidooxidans]|uniref:Uncharacterized protein n=2 Tax=Sulfobacillus thermosulfidooxidans TaxID=28034 RepID=A0A1W1W7Z0_SULTA|nr:hypothetical protein [Sulfobacillus thermosulfidooxidans]OLZ10559.1 hypothetical protein BFX05_01640 [Sulfobacillus thermosulfidooxidans]OLZ16796.1 hypothetical protein BFX06_14375 [Sulfobacillus thermosulfidooxidans]OLZ22236.1 hypothetical protein BFX07_10255 [Sulfobacillus thermosulfidooxidans]PSR26967.1 MAG: hypothetical protein C7B47_09535 [Sulfobacillus thermosulfidooxidans]SMC02312.1 hypothetical protein SAMN00768000_0527 [Sulfobacillus thermosulfidooxidans DSM 9293]